MAFSPLSVHPRRTLIEEKNMNAVLKLVTDSGDPGMPVLAQFEINYVLGRLGIADDVTSAGEAS